MARPGARELLPEEARRTAALEVLEPPPRAGSLSTARHVRARLRDLRPDAVLTYNFGAMDAALAARTLGLAHVHHEDGFLRDETARQLKRRVLYRRLALARSRRVIVISETLRRIATEVWRLAPERTVFIPNGIDVGRFEPRDGNAPLRRELGIPESALVVGAVGHLRPEKNLPRLIEACAAAARALDLHLVALGEGPERERIETAARVPALAGRVHLVGHHADPRGHYRMMDVFASASDTEQMPISLLEAMASSLPVVATDVGDVRAMLPEEQRGLVTPARGPDGEAGALAASLIALGRDPDSRSRLGETNRRRVLERFDREAMTRAYRDVYDTALG